MNLNHKPKTPTSKIPLKPSGHGAAPAANAKRLLPLELRYKNKHLCAAVRVRRVSYQKESIRMLFYTGSTSVLPGFYSGPMRVACFCSGLR